MLQSVTRSLKRISKATNIDYNRLRNIKSGKVEATKEEDNKIMSILITAMMEIPEFNDTIYSINSK